MLSPWVPTPNSKDTHIRENFWNELWHAKCLEVLNKKKLDKLEINDFSWIYQITEVAGQTATLEIWIDEHRVAATKVCLLEPKLLDPKWLETLKWSFWWITGGWLWTSMNVRKSWEWQTGLHIIMGFPSRNPSRFSLWGSQKNLILVVAGGGADEPLWSIPRVFSITKAYGPRQMIFVWTQFWNHIQAGKMEFLFT